MSVIIERVLTSNVITSLLEKIILKTLKQVSGLSLSYYLLTSQNRSCFGHSIKIIYTIGCLLIESTPEVSYGKNLCPFVNDCQKEVPYSHKNLCPLIFVHLACAKFKQYECAEIKGRRKNAKINEKTANLQ